MRPLIVILALACISASLFAQNTYRPVSKERIAVEVSSDVHFFTRPLNPNELPSSAPFHDASIIDIHDKRYRLAVSYDRASAQFRVKLPTEERVLLLPQVQEMTNWNGLRLTSVSVETEQGPREWPAVILVEGDAMLYRRFGTEETVYFSRMHDEERAEILGLKSKDLRVVFDEKPPRVKELLSRYRHFREEPLLIELFQLYNG